MNIRRNQQGIGVLEALLILVLIGIIGFTGWFVWHSQKAMNKTFNEIDASSTSKTTKSKPLSTISDGAAVLKVQAAYDTYRSDSIKAGNISNNQIVPLDNLRKSLTSSLYNSLKQQTTQSTITYDPILCAQNIADSFNAQLFSSTDDTATIHVIGQWQNGPDASPIIVQLAKTTGLITEITCPTP